MKAVPVPPTSDTDSRWIISVHQFHEHLTLESMETELARLKTLCPEKTFHVYQIKRQPAAGVAVDHTPEPAQSKRASRFERKLTLPRRHEKQSDHLGT
jgi:hypothetical protein